MTVTTLKTFKVRGENEDITTCECCGRTDLNKTIALEYVDEDGSPSGEMTYFGTTCAAKAAGWTTKFVKDEVKAINEAARQARVKAQNEAAKNEREQFEQFLVEVTGIPVNGSYIRHRREFFGTITAMNTAYAEWLAAR